MSFLLQRDRCEGTVEEETRWHRFPRGMNVPGGAALLAFALLPCHVTGASAQTISGVLVDGDSGAPLANGTVLVTGPGEGRATAITGPEGRFRLTLEQPGTVRISASLLGYRDSEEMSLTVGSAQELTVVIRMAVRPLDVEGITVVAEGLELRHRRTYAGFLERRTSAPRVGPARVVTHEDPEMVAAFDLPSVLRQFPPVDKCLVIYVDGIHQPYGVGFGSQERGLLPGQRPNEIRERFNRWPISLDGVAGVELYRWYEDAPLEMREPRYPCIRPPFSVVALWHFPVDSLPGRGNRR